MSALKGTERELSKFGKHAETGLKKVSAKTGDSIARFMESKRAMFGGMSPNTQNAETS